MNGQISVTAIPAIQSGTFAEACYDMNSLAELSENHSAADADDTDCETWGITTDEWSEAVELALRHRLADAADAV